VGFRERSSSFIADLKRCEILAPPVGDLVEPLSLLISSMSVRAKVPQIEVAVADHAVALVIRILDALTPEDRQALEAFELAHSVEIYLQPGGYDTIAPLRERPSVLEYRLDQFDIAVQFQPTDFVQVNGPLNSLMVERAVQLLKPTANDRVLDLFCGLGNFSLPLARSAAHVTGVEGEAGLVRRARENAQRNSLDNTEFYVANLTEPNRESAWAKAHYDKVLLDPPRAGAREVLDVVARSGAASVLYISCHPGSLARDAGVLVQEHGFKLVSAGVMDMFPHTAHIESMALFERAS
jgi:23S rRNA (uracil1939-C5)-methyltransferase